MEYDAVTFLNALFGAAPPPSGGGVAATERELGLPEGALPDLIDPAATPIGTPTPAIIDPEVAGWNQDARYVYEERLGVAADLGMDTSTGGEADLIARRDARRAAAELPMTVGATLEPGLLDGALAAFAPFGGLSCVKHMPREGFEAERRAWMKAVGIAPPKSCPTLDLAQQERDRLAFGDIPASGVASPGAAAEGGR